MSKNKQEKTKDVKLKKEADKKIYNTKDFLLTSCKRYGIILIISMPIILIFNFIMSNEVSWYNTTLAVFVTIFLLLLSCFLGIIIFNKIDDKREREKTKENQRDPFAD